MTTKLQMSRPKDKSFESFKKWMAELSSALDAKQTLTEKELKAGWVKFWKGK